MDIEKLSDFSFTRKIHITKRILNTLLFIALIIFINAIFANYSKRIDLTEKGLYSLSAETKAHLRILKHPTKIQVLLPRDSAQPELELIHTHLGHLLRSFQVSGMVNRDQLLGVEYIDPYRQRTKAQSVFNRFNIKDENIILVSQEDRYQIIRQADLYEVVDNQISGFKGEQAITSAIINVNSGETHNVYFLFGHGEMRLKDSDAQNGLSQVKAFLENRNFNTHSLNLLKENAIPENASLVIVASPQAELMPVEVDLLRRYMNDRNGRLIVLIDPGRLHGMNELFFDWGILAENEFIYESDSSLISNSDDFIIHQFAEHPINELLLDYNLNAVFGQPRPIKKDPLATANKRLSVKEILGTSESSWIERNYGTEFPPSYHPKKDLKGPISIAAVSNLSYLSSLDINIPSGRIAVFGNATFISNNHFQIFGNQILFNNTLNWILDRMHLLKIPIRTIETFQITMSQRDTQVMLAYYTIPPILIALWGFLILYLRKR